MAKISLDIDVRAKDTELTRIKSELQRLQDTRDTLARNPIGKIIDIANIDSAISRLSALQAQIAKIDTLQITDADKKALESSKALTADTQRRWRMQIDGATATQGILSNIGSALTFGAVLVAANKLKDVMSSVVTQAAEIQARNEASTKSIAASIQSRSAGQVGPSDAIAQAQSLQSAIRAQAQTRSVATDLGLVASIAAKLVETSTDNVTDIARLAVGLSDALAEASPGSEMADLDALLSGSGGKLSKLLQIDATQRQLIDTGRIVDAIGRSVSDLSDKSMATTRTLSGAKAQFRSAYEDAIMRVADVSGGNIAKAYSDVADAIRAIPADKLDAISKSISMMADSAGYLVTKLIQAGVAMAEFTASDPMLAKMLVSAASLTLAYAAVGTQLGKAVGLLVQLGTTSKSAALASTITQATTASNALTNSLRASSLQSAQLAQSYTTGVAAASQLTANTSQLTATTATAAIQAGSVSTGIASAGKSMLSLLAAASKGGAILGLLSVSAYGLYKGISGIVTEIGVLSKLIKRDATDSVTDAAQRLSDRTAELKSAIVESANGAYTGKAGSALDLAIQAAEAQADSYTKIADALTTAATSFDQYTVSGDRLIAAGDTAKKEIDRINEVLVDGVIHIATSLQSTQAQLQAATQAGDDQLVSTLTAQVKTLQERYNKAYAAASSSMQGGLNTSLKIAKTDYETRLAMLQSAGDMQGASALTTAYNANIQSLRSEAGLMARIKSQYNTAYNQLTSVETQTLLDRVTLVQASASGVADLVTRINRYAPGSIDVKSVLGANIKSEAEAFVEAYDSNVTQTRDLLAAAEKRKSDILAGTYDVAGTKYTATSIDAILADDSATLAAKNSALEAKAMMQATLANDPVLISIKEQMAGLRAITDESIKLRQDAGDYITKVADDEQASAIALLNKQIAAADAGQRSALAAEAITKLQAGIIAKQAVGDTNAVKAMQTQIEGLQQTSRQADEVTRAAAVALETSIGATSTSGQIDAKLSALTSATQRVRTATAAGRSVDAVIAQTEANNVAKDLYGLITQQIGEISARKQAISDITAQIASVVGLSDTAAKQAITKAKEVVAASVDNLELAKVAGTSDQVVDAQIKLAQSTAALADAERKYADNLIAAVSDYGAELSKYIPDASSIIDVANNAKLARADNDLSNAMTYGTGLDQIQAFAAYSKIAEGIMTDMRSRRDEIGTTGAQGLEQSSMSRIGVGYTYAAGWAETRSADQSLSKLESNVAAIARHMIDKDQTAIDTF